MTLVCGIFSLFQAQCDDMYVPLNWLGLKMPEQKQENKETKIIFTLKALTLI